MSATLDAAPPAPIHRVGNVELDTGRRAIVSTGTLGFLAVRGQLFRLAERLMRRPGVIVSRSDLIAAMYSDPDAEPETADVVLRAAVQELRVVLRQLSGGHVLIRTEIGTGYAVDVDQRRR